MMRVVRRLCLTIIIALAAANLLPAQETLYNFNTNSGLPSDEVYCVFMDRQGYLWFGTDHGVAKYNGYGFEQFTTEDGMTDNTIFSIKQDDEDNIWFLTATGGICYYNGKKISPHPMNDSITPLCVKQIPTSWEVLPGKVVWLGFVLKGFYRAGPNAIKGYLNGQGVDRNKNYDKIYINVLNFKNAGFVYASLIKDTDLQIAAPEISYLKTYMTDAQDVEFPGLNYTLIKLENDDVLMGLWKKLLLLSSKKMLDRVSLPVDVKVIMLKKAGDNKIWATCSNAPTYLVEVDSLKIHLADSITSAVSVTDLLIGKQGNYWLSTLEKGVYMMPNLNIKRYTHTRLNHDMKVVSLAVNKKSLFAGLEHNGVLKIGADLKSTFLENLKEPSPVTGMEFDENDQLITANSFNRWTPFGFFFKKILRVRKDIYLAGGSGGFMVVEDDKAFFNSHDVGFALRVTDICSMGDSSYLIGSTNGLYRFSVKDNFVLKKDSGLGDIRVTSCRALNANTYAVATRGKGLHLTVNGKKFWIDENLGLISNLAEDVYFENHSVCWVASFKGLSKVYFALDGDSLRTRIKCYSKEDGLCSNQINAITGYGGYLWLGTNEGLCYLDPKNLPEDTTDIPVYFRDTYVNGKKFNVQDATLRYNQNNITINFNGLFYKAVSGVRYKVRMKGLEDWKYTTDNSVQYFGLPGNEYDFEITAEDKFGRYRSDVKTLHFTIKPHFTDTIWFTLLMIVSAIIITGVFVYMFLRYQRLKSENLIKLMQAEFKALNYQINPHFIFNVLNSIQYFILGKDTRKAVHFLSSFSALIRKIVNNSRQQYVSLLEEVECLKEYLDLEKLRLDNKFDYEINIDSGIDIEDKLVLPMILQPLVENSIWHGLVPAGRQGKIKIDFSKSGNHILCTIDDNGVGINHYGNKDTKSQNNLSLAIKNVTERLKIISDLNNSTWDIKLEDKSAKNPDEQGTVATILFPSAKPIK